MNPVSELEIDSKLISELIQNQHPNLANLDIRSLDKGWDNEIYRLGDDYLIRLPRRKVAAELILNEIHILNQLKHKLPIGFPAPIALGKPDTNYPWHWAIYPYFEGKTAALSQPDESEAERLINFLKALHSENPDNVKFNAYRSIPLSGKNEAVYDRIYRLEKESQKQAEAIRVLWEEAIACPMPEEKSLIHADLHPLNILVKKKKIEAIIDWGDVTHGDPATDLASLWMLFDDRQMIEDAFKNYGASDQTILKSKGWAIFYATFFLDAGMGKQGVYDNIAKKALTSLGLV